MAKNKEENNNPLSNATWKKDIVAIQDLVKNATQNDKDFALYLTAMQSSNNIMQILLDNGAKADFSRNYHPLVEVAKQGNIEGMKLLLKNRFNINARSGKSLLKAIDNKQTEMINFILENGINLEAYGTSAIELTVRNNDIETCKVLLDKGVKCDENLGWSLMTACNKGYYQIASLLLDKGANAQGYKNSNGPIYLANKNKHQAIVTLLKEYGADLNAVNKDEINKIKLNKMYSSVKKVQKVLSTSSQEKDKNAQIVRSIETHFPEVVNTPRIPNHKFNKFVIDLNDINKQYYNKKPKM